LNSESRFDGIAAQTTNHEENMANKWLLKVTPAQNIYENEIKNGVVVGQKLILVVSALEGYLAALEVVSQGEKLFEVWEFRKRLEQFAHPNDKSQNVGFIVLDDFEKDTLLRGIKTVDWTFRGTNNIWVRWRAFFEDLQAIAVFDEKDPPLDYLDDKARFEASIKAYEDAVRDAEAKRLSELNQETDVILSTKLKELQDAGKLGSAATIEDLSTEVKKTARDEARKAIADRNQTKN
jgi:hypothetical protein